MKLGMHQVTHGPDTPMSSRLIQLHPIQSQEAKLDQSDACKHPCCPIHSNLMQPQFHSFLLLNVTHGIPHVPPLQFCHTTEVLIDHAAKLPSGLGGGRAVHTAIQSSTTQAIQAYFNQIQTSKHPRCPIQPNLVQPDQTQPNAAQFKPNQPNL